MCSPRRRALNERAASCPNLPKPFRSLRTLRAEDREQLRQVIQLHIPVEIHVALFVRCAGLRAETGQQKRQVRQIDVAVAVHIAIAARYEALRPAHDRRSGCETYEV